MKKRKCIPALLALALTLSACGGSPESTTSAGGGSETATNAAGTSSGADEPLTRKDTSDGEKDTPLTREDAAEKESESSGLPEGMDISQVMSADTIWADQDEEIKQALISDFKAQGMEISFGSDRTTKVVDKDGTVSVQNADGSWHFQSADGSEAQYGGDWPENEFTKLVPKPSFGVMAADTSDTEFNVLFSGADIDAVKAYAREVQKNGFSSGPKETDQDIQGTVVYTFEATNRNGYRVTVFSSAGTSGMTITKE